MKQVPKNNKLRKTKSRLGQENLKKEVEPIAPTRKLVTDIIYYIEVPIQVKTNFEEEVIPPPLRSRGVFIVGFPLTGPSPLNTLEL